MKPFINTRTASLASIIALTASSAIFAQTGYAADESKPAFFLQDAVKLTMLDDAVTPDAVTTTNAVKPPNPLEDAAPGVIPGPKTASVDDTSTANPAVKNWTTPLPILDGLDLDFTLDRYQVKWPEGETWTIRVQKMEATGHASIFINNQEVMKFRSGLDSLDAYDRAHIVAQRLFQYLSQMPKKISIQPEFRDGESLIKAGDLVLTRIDTVTADAAQNSPRVLATVWSNQIRESLGLDPLAAPLPDLSNFRGEMSKKYHLPLSADFYDETSNTQSGMASWYGPGFHGRRAADGSRYDMNRMTAAHKHLPFGTVVKVTNQRNGKSCLVQITDRGPYAHGRVIDLSKAAANAIGVLSSGVAKVKLQVLTPRKSSAVTNGQKLSSRT